MRRLGLIVFLFLLAGAAFAAGVQATPSTPPSGTPAPPAPQAGPRQFDIAPAPPNGGPEHFGQFRLAPRDRIQLQQKLGAGDQGACLKLHKFVFRRDDSSDRMKYVGDTYCTYGGHVSTRSTGDPDPKPSGFGLYKAVAH